MSRGEEAGELNLPPTTTATTLSAEKQREIDTIIEKTYERLDPDPDIDLGPQEDPIYPDTFSSDQLDRVLYDRLDEESTD